jgi:signal peptidase I
MDLTTILLLFLFLFPMLNYWIFQDAGYDGYKALIPFYNYYIWLKVIGKPWWWLLLMLVPFINFFMIMLMLVQTAISYGKNGLAEQALAVVVPFAYLPYLGISEKEKYIAPEKRVKFKKSQVREWTDAIIFAVVAASIIRIFMMEAYTIPSSSMEKSLLVGDFLFVSKMSYGPKLPNTPIAFPFVHHTMPFTTSTKSYLEWIQWPYYRFPGFNTIKNNDVVVFNYPDGDTVSTVFQSNVSYYTLIKDAGRDRVWNDKANFGDIVTRPVDKRENFIKRCIGIPGDSVQVIDRQVYVNGKKVGNPEDMQFNYQIVTNADPINKRQLRSIGISDEDINNYRMSGSLPLSSEEIKKLKEFPNIVDVVPMVSGKDSLDIRLFPCDSAYRFNVDNYGPVWIPKAGTTIPVSLHNLPLYRRVIETYENNKLEVKDGKILINGSEATSYTFKMNYYWMMGDNRHNSADSRFWGFVPEDHIVGKAVFVWLSLDKDKSLFDGKIRWSKLFRFVN